MMHPDHRRLCQAVADLGKALHAIVKAPPSVRISIDAAAMRELQVSIAGNDEWTFGPDHKIDIAGITIEAAKI